MRIYYLTTIFIFFFFPFVSIKSQTCSFPYNPFSDTIKVCGKQYLLNAGDNFSSYTWNIGSQASTLNVTKSGFYKIRVTNQSGCIGIDSTYISLVWANILQNDTVVCTGKIIQLSVDSLFPEQLNNGLNYSPNLIKNLIAFYPFSGNAKDLSPSSNNGNVLGATLTQDRFGQANSAYFFNPANQSRIIISSLNKTMKNSFSYSFWVKPEMVAIIPSQGQGPNAASGLINNPCVIHPIHGWNYGDASNSAGTGIYVGTNGLYLEEHSDGWEAVPISYLGDLSGWHLINIIYEDKVPILYIDGKFIKKGLASSRNIYASLGKDNFPLYNYTNSGIGAGYWPTVGTGQYFKGSIDEIAYYDRALQSHELNQIFNNRPLVIWSTGDTSIKTNITTDVSRIYYAKVSDGINTCIDSVKISILKVDTSLFIKGNLSLCPNKDSVIIIAASDLQYQWTRNSLILNTYLNNTIIIKDTGSYRVILKNILGCIDSSRLVTVTQFSQPFGIFTPPSNNTICEGTPIILTASQSYAYQWLKDNFVIPGAVFPNFNADMPGEYTVNFISINGCIKENNAKVLLNLVKPPSVDFVFDKSCINSLITFSSTSSIENSGSVSYNWNFGNGNIVNGANVAKYTYSNSGIYQVKLTVTPLLCKNLERAANKNIKLNDQISGIKYSPINVLINKDFQLTARNIGISYLWRPRAGLNQYNSRTPIFNFNSNQLYYIDIIDNSGCIITDTLLVRIFKNNEIYVPTGFSPDNDGKNDKLYPILVGIVEMKVFRIYNRWGVLLYDNKNANMSSGWDGKYLGVDQPIETYVWMAEGVDEDGKIIRRSGNTVLIR